MSNDTVKAVETFMEYLIPDKYHREVLCDFISIHTKSTVSPSFRWAPVLVGPHGVGKFVFTHYIMRTAVMYDLEIPDFLELYEDDERKHFDVQIVAIKGYLDTPESKSWIPGYLRTSATGSPANLFILSESEISTEEQDHPPSTFNIHTTTKIGDPVIFSRMIHHMFACPEDVAEHFQQRKLKHLVNEHDINQPPDTTLET